jgi:hypothetical protein
MSGHNVISILVIVAVYGKIASREQDMNHLKLPLLSCVELTRIHFLMNGAYGVECCMSIRNNPTGNPKKDSIGSLNLKNGVCSSYRQDIVRIKCHDLQIIVLT